MNVNKKTNLEALFRNNKFFSAFMILVFLATSVLMVVPSIHTGRLAAHADWLFHASRVEQIYENLKQGEFFTFIATNTFQQSGVGNFLFYPTLFFYPWAILRFFLDPIKSLYVWYSLFTFLAFLTSYFSAFKLVHNKIGSVTFSFLYVLSSYRIYLGNFVFGEFIASTFIPLAFLGLYDVLWGEKDDWYLLSIGLSLIAYSHLVSTMLCLEFFVLIFLGKVIINNGLSLQRINALLKSIILTIFLVIGDIFPFLTDYIGRNVTSARKGIGMISDFSTVMVNSLNNNAENASIGILSLIILMFGWYWLNKNSIGWAAYFLGIIALVMGTSLFPWANFNNGFLATIQLTFRYLLYTCFFMAVVGAYGVSKIKFLKNKSVFVPYIFAIFSMIFGLFIYSSLHVNRFGDIKKYNETTNLKPAQTNGLFNLPDSQIDKNNYNNQFSYRVPYGEFDYFPKKATSEGKIEGIISHKAIINKNFHQVNPIGLPNKLIYNLNLNKKAQVDLPVVLYNNSHVMIDGKKAPYVLSDRATPMVSVPKGTHKLSVSYHPPVGYYCAISVSAMTFLFVVLFLLIRGCKSKFSKRKISY